ncbi:MlaD family protein [Nocardia bovistercoris]|uniref:MCE family protein n=1 Tax=Nocardia bovistercoris TaxID=2785916 RepID=A0A931N7D9_9NOCA|nr:MlaD family protein [Nocardia bovistercoris]MBH0780653.1 MCE family protein [Nocardia bovistercoris]
MTTHPRPRDWALIALTTLALLTGCAFDPAALPVPGTGVSGETYRLRIEFADVLNLPRGAKVIANGVQIGRLTNLTAADPTPATPDRPARPGHILAEVAIESSVRLATGTRAALRQDTPPRRCLHRPHRTPPAATGMPVARGHNSAGRHRPRDRDGRHLRRTGRVRQWRRGR